MQIQQSTTAYALVFFMADSADHITGKTGLTPTVTISKNGAAFGAVSGAVSEISSGWYKVAGNATDSNTLGSLALHATGTGADPCDMLFEVVKFDLANGRTGMDFSNFTSLAAGGMAPLGIVDSGTLQSATGTGAVIRSAASFADNLLNGATIILTGGTGAGQARTITGNTQSSDAIVVDTWTTTPDNTSTYIIVGTPPGSTVSPLPVNVTAMASDVITSSVLDTTAVAEIVAAVFARAFSAAYGSLTFEQIMKIVIAALAAKISGAGTTTVTIRNINDSADVIVATVDADGNRSAVTLTP